MNKLYVVIPPSAKGTAMPMFYYMLADDEDEAVRNVHRKWGIYDPKAIIRELSEEELKNLVIATNFYG